MRIVFYTQLVLKIGPRFLYLLYLRPRPNGKKLRWMTLLFRISWNALDGQKWKKTMGFPLLFHFSLKLYSLYFSLTY